jgi:hypothetical protein
MNVRQDSQRPTTAGPLRRVVLLGLLIALAWCLLGAGATSEPPAPAPTEPTSIPLLPANLPVVPRPPTSQPQVGLPSDTHLDKTPPRKTKGLDLVRSGWTYNCMACHTLFAGRWHYDRPMAEHQDVHLDHGNNRYCLNCHHPKNRNAFVDYDGSEIAQADVVQLCGKCHGTTYRDWQAGVHGRSNGYWNSQSGTKTKLRCIQCHDPHHPAFQPMKPLAPLRYPPRAANPPAATSTPAHANSSPK